MNDDQLQTYNYQKTPTKRRVFFLLLSTLTIGTIILFGIIRFSKHAIIIDNTSKDKTGPQEARDIPQEEFNPIPSQEANRLTVLLLGMRGEEDIEDGGLLTDSIVLATIDKKNGNADLISIPRDLYINMLGVKGKLNSAYETGLSKNKGLSLISEIVSRITGVYVNKTVIFDFRAFKDIVDALDGVDITLDKAFTEPSQWGYEFNLPAGVNHLNGEQALYFVRSRYSTSDFDRAKRQQQIITAIKDKALSLGLFTNPSKVTSLYGSLSGHIKTNFQVWDISDILILAQALGNTSKIKTHVLSTDNVLYQTKTTSGEYILLTKSGNYKDIQSILTNIKKSTQDKSTVKNNLAPTP